MIVKISGKNYDYFNEFSLDRKYDSIGSSFSLSALFEPDSSIHREIFKPFTYPLIEIFEGGKKLFTGYIVNNKFSLSKNAKLSPLSGYSKTGFLEDCDVPKSVYPLSFNNLGLREIATQLCNPFDLKVVVHPSATAIADEVYDQIETEDVKSIKSFLTELATQKNLLLSHTVEGELLITKTNTDAVPVANLGSSGNTESFTLSTNGRKMFSDNLVMQDADVDTDNASEAEVSNPYVKRFRSKTWKQSSGNNNQTEDTARNVLSTQLKAITLNIEINSVFWNNGILIEPNQIITVESPELYLFKKTKFFVESVKFKGNAKRVGASIVCVPLEVYNESEVVSIF
ncbi:MAG: hypothetical protein S4CHLAM20_04290 [Chlamydiia bacterium]|nr:hypothetical protein [Chlamydiia bacterium]